MAKWGDIKPIKGFTWSVQHGVAPATTKIIVPKDTVVPKEPKDITLNDNETKIVNIFAISERQINATMKEITLADERYFWERKLIYAVKNQTISAGAIKNVTQYDERFFNQPIIAPKTAKESRTDLVNGLTVVRAKAWSAFELLYNYLLLEILGYPENKVSAGIGSVQDAQAGVGNSTGRINIYDNGYIPLNWIKLGVPLTAVMDELLTMLCLRIQLLNDGTVRVYSPYDTESTELFMKDKKSISELAKIEPRLQRPKYVRVKVPKRQEVRVKLKSTFETESDQEFSMYNVTQLPYDIKDSAGNLYIRNGYYPIQAIVGILGSGSFTVGQVSFVEGQVQGQMQGGDQITGSKKFTWDQFNVAVYNPWAWNNMFLGNFLTNTSSLIEVTLRTLLSKIQRDFRTLFQISPRNRNQFFTYAPIVGVPLDASTGASAASPVFCDYSAWLRYPIKGMGKDNPEPRGKNVVYNENVAAPFFMNIENEALGILRLSSGEDKEGFVYESFMLTLWDNFPSWGNYVAGIPFHGCKANKSFRLSTILSVVKYDELYVSDADDVASTPQQALNKSAFIDPSRTLIKDVPGGTSDVTLELTYTEYPAIFTLAYGWINRLTINNIIENMIMPDVEAMFRDQIVGTHEVPGIDNKAGELPGYCGSMQYTETPTKTSTIYIFNQPLPPRPNWKDLSNEAKRHVFRNNIFDYKIT